MLLLMQVYGRRLTALVLDKLHQGKTAHSPGGGEVEFGDSGAGTLVSVLCH